MTNQQRLLRTSVASTAVIGATLYATSTPLYAEEARPAQPQRAEIRPGRSSNGDKVGVLYITGLRKVRLTGSYPFTLPLNLWLH